MVKDLVRNSPARPARILLLIVVAVLSSANASARDNPGLTLTSPAFTQGQSIPQQYTCEGANISPALQWHNLPAGTRSLALIVDDPDAPDPAAPRITWVHWVLYDIPPTTEGLAMHMTTAQLPKGAAQGSNSWNKVEYGGPCPPIGRHRYFFKLYALDSELQFAGPPTKGKLLSAMKGHVVGETSLMGTYQKQR